ncbi:matrixin family metalloprotease [Aquihabitans sp. McL0605]|uniref:matrixin family metalloprotease n=1 Tax=Aquihabitans sp. McL0605 TaxID=3415671 RepID=UPI003CEF89AE
MADESAGPDDEVPGDDPFRALLDPEFARAATVREPSAQDRAEAARRAERASSLAARVAADGAARAHEARRVRRRQRRGWIVLGLVLVPLIGLAVWRMSVHSTGSGGDLSSGHPAPDLSAARSPLGKPPPSPRDPGPFAFIHSHADGSPVTWDPCRPIRYVVNPAGAPASGDEVIRGAIRRTSEATGLEFEAAGETDEAASVNRPPFQPGRYGDRWAPVLIAWSDEEATPELGGAVAGLTVPLAATDPQRDELAYVSGVIILDTDVFAGAGSVSGDRARAIVQHEAGHLVGLDHVDDAHQLMYPSARERSALDWGSGDLAGLHQLGSGTCRPAL